MYISELFHGGPEQPKEPKQAEMMAEANQTQLVVLYPGRFQPFHLGHADVFRTLQAKFGRDNTYIATSNVTDNKKSPFNFTDKVMLMNAAGVPSDRILEVASPYKLPAQFDPTTTVFVVAIGAPDADRLRPDSVKKDGNPGYYKTFKSLAECETADKHGYVVIAAERHKVISLMGQQVDVSHGTPSRAAWNMVRNDPEGRAEYMTQMFGRADVELGRVLDKIPASVGESLEEGIFDRFKRKPEKPDDPQMMRAFNAAGGYDRDIDVMAWQIGWKTCAADPAADPKEVFQKMYYGGGSSFPFDQKSFMMAFNACAKMYNNTGMEEAISPEVQKAKQGPMKTVWNPVTRKYKVVPAAQASLEEDDMAPMSREEYNSRRRALQQIQMDPELTRDPTLRKELIKKIAQLTMQARSAGVLPESVYAAHVQENRLFEAKAIVNTVKYLKESAKQLNEESPLSQVGFSDAFINRVYRGYNIKHTELPEPMTKKPSVADLDKYVFLSKTNTGKAFAVGKGNKNWAGSAIGYVTIDNGDGTIKEINLPPNKAIAQVAKGEYYAIPFAGWGGRIRGQRSTEYKRANPRDGRQVDPQDASYEYMQKIDKIYGEKIRGEMNKTVDFVYANMRKFSKQQNSRISGTSPQEQVLEIANILEAAANNKDLFSNRSGSWDNPSYMEQYLNSLSKLHHGFASIPNNYHQFAKVMDETPAGLAKFAKFILGTVHAYEEKVKELLYKDTVDALKQP